MNHQACLILALCLLGLAFGCSSDAPEVSGTTPLSDSSVYQGKYFVFNNDQGIRIVENTPKGFQTQAFYPGKGFNEIMKELTDPQMIETQEGEILFYRDIQFDAERIQITNKFFRVTGNNLVEMSMKNETAEEQ